jgi:hypothetical protein
MEPGVSIEHDELAPILLDDDGDPQVFDKEEDADENEGAEETLLGGEEPEPPDEPPGDDEDDTVSETNEGAIMTNIGANMTTPSSRTHTVT